MSVAWDPDFYKTGYEGFERPENFPTPEALADYRKLLLQKTGAQVEFVAKHFGDRRLRVIEYGAGNGRLLIALALCGMLDFGLGIDISRSRITFARLWADELGLTNVHTVDADILSFEPEEKGSFDLAVCITGALGYFRPICESAPHDLLHKMYQALRPSGRLLLELHQMADRRRRMLDLNNNELRLWQPLPTEDRFAYYLDDFRYWPDRKILSHGKIFIGRDGTVDAGRSEVLAYYDREELHELLRQNSFQFDSVYGDFKETPYRDGESTELVALATAVPAD